MAEGKGVEDASAGYEIVHRVHLFGWRVPLPQRRRAASFDDTTFTSMCVFRGSHDFTGIVHRTCSIKGRAVGGSFRSVIDRSPHVFEVIRAVLRLPSNQKLKVVTSAGC